MKIVIVAAIIAVVVTAEPSLAQQAPGTFVRWITAGDLYGLCTTPSQEGACIGYIEAVADTLEASGGGAFGLTTCTPPGTNGFRLREIVLNYIEQEPSVKPMVGANVVALALATKFPFPCRSPKP